MPALDSFISPAGPMPMTAVFGYFSYRISSVSYMPFPTRGAASSNFTPSFVMTSVYHLFAGGVPSIMMAASPSRAIFCPERPPAFDSLIPPVSGLFAPKEVRPLLGAAGEPVTQPGAMTSLLCGPSGWQVGSTSSNMMCDVNPRPAQRAHFSGTSSYVAVRSVMLILKIFLAIAVLLVLLKIGWCAHGRCAWFYGSVFLFWYV